MSKQHVFYLNNTTNGVYVLRDVAGVHREYQNVIFLKNHALTVQLYIIFDVFAPATKVRLLCSDFHKTLKARAALFENRL